MFWDQTQIFDVLTLVPEQVHIMLGSPGSIPGKQSRLLKGRNSLNLENAQTKYSFLHIFKNNVDVWDFPPHESKRIINVNWFILS